MEPVIVRPLIYVLELEDDCYYVGITMNLNLRLAQHWAGNGSKWTGLHKPRRVVEIFVDDATLAKENEVTQLYKTKYGDDKVRGGFWVKV